MPFKKGQKKMGGRKKGTPNEFTKVQRSVKETVLAAFNKLQEDPKANIEAWGRENPRDFYTIAAKLIPTEVQANIQASETTPLLTWVKKDNDSTK